MSIYSEYDTDVYTVKIINDHLKDRWYKIGETYRVRNYRLNPKEYWELASWDGDRHDPHFWILKTETIIIKDPVRIICDIPDEVFD